MFRKPLAEYDNIPTLKTGTGQPLVIKGQAISTRTAINMINAGTFETKLTGYYDDQFKFDNEFTVPEFNKLDRIEKLELLHKKREEVKKYQRKLEELGKQHDPEKTINSTTLEQTDGTKAPSQ